MLDLVGAIAGWVGLGTATLISLPQLWRLLKGGNTVALWTYYLIVAMCALLLTHAIYKGTPVFIATNAWGIAINLVVITVLRRRQ